MVSIYVLSDCINYVLSITSFSCRGGKELALLLALMSCRNVRQANVPMRGGHYSVRAAWCITFWYVTLRVWRANEGGTTDLPDYSEIVPRDRTLF